MLRLGHVLPGIFPKRLVGVHPTSSNAVSEFLCWKRIKTNARAYNRLYALHTTPFRKEKGSKGSQRWFRQDLYLLSGLRKYISQVSRKLCLKFPLLQADSDAWSIGCSCVVKEIREK
ncbi:hypothetical protein H1C71_013655 [Ictidomys tridecemlineatus]|nr:hypothetical protein H1C71_013655 [Ictidomys tridecemlineatus]